jgi:hypothetical protein
LRMYLVPELVPDIFLTDFSYSIEYSRMNAPSAESPIVHLQCLPKERCLKFTI